MRYLVAGFAVLGFGAVCVGCGTLAGFVWGWRTRGAIAPKLPDMGANIANIAALHATVQRLKAERAAKTAANAAALSSLPRTH
jgi:hypothetical protein